MGRTSKRSQTAGHEAIRQLAPNTAPEGPGPDGGPGDQPTWTFPVSAALVQAAKAFRKIFVDNNAEYHLLGGQFALVDAMMPVLRAKITTITNTPLRRALLALIEDDAWSDLSNAMRSAGVRIVKESQAAMQDGDPDKTRLPGLLRAKSTVMGTTAYKTATANASQLIEAPEVSAEDEALAKAVLTDHSATGIWAEARINQWFAQKTIGPTNFDKVSLPRLCAVFINSLIMCVDTAGYTGRKLLKTRNVNVHTLPSFARTTLTGLSRKDNRSNPDNLMLNYKPAALLNAVTSAAALLNAGGYLTAGCLSGKIHEGENVPAAQRHPFPEHSILLFASDNKTFLFWDPDVTSADIHDLKNQLGLSIGVLFYDDTDPNRPKFSTGIDFDDLSGIESDGDHKKFPERHRYQIVTLQKP